MLPQKYMQLMSYHTHINYMVNYLLKMIWLLVLAFLGWPTICGFTSITSNDFNTKFIHCVPWRWNIISERSTIKTCCVKTSYQVRVTDIQIVWCGSWNVVYGYLYRHIIMLINMCHNQGWWIGYYPISHLTIKVRFQYMWHILNKCLCKVDKLHQG